MFVFSFVVLKRLPGTVEIPNCIDQTKRSPVALKVLRTGKSGRKLIAGKPDNCLATILSGILHDGMVMVVNGHAVCGLWPQSRENCADMVSVWERQTRSHSGCCRTVV